MPNGYMGKILWVSLNDMKTSTLNTMDYAEKYLGGKGIATRIFLKGCDVKTGNPTRATLEKYGLQDVADELEKLGKLP
jgi:hypothetical protein